MKILVIVSLAIALWSLILMFFWPKLSLLVLVVALTTAMCAYDELLRKRRIRIVRRGTFPPR